MILRIAALAGVVLFSSHALSAQDVPAGCGPDTTQFKVKTEKAKEAPGAPAAGMGQIIFVETLEGDFNGAPTIRFASDGQWLGATRGRSYFVATVPPGAHPICGSRQTAIASERSTKGLTVNVEAGKTYYVEFHVTRLEMGPATMKAGAALPGQYPGSLTAKERPTMDTWTMEEVKGSDGASKLPGLALSKCTTK